MKLEFNNESTEMNIKLRKYIQTKPKKELKGLGTCHQAPDSEKAV